MVILVENKTIFCRSNPCWHIIPNVFINELPGDISVWFMQVKWALELARSDMYKSVAPTRIVINKVSQADWLNGWVKIFDDDVDGCLNTNLPLRNITKENQAIFWLNVSKFQDKLCDPCHNSEIRNSYSFYHESYRSNT